MRTFTRYALFQIPGLTLTGIVLGTAVSWWELPAGSAAGLFLLWVIKDLVLYPFLKAGYEAGGKTGLEGLVGRRGVVRRELAPEGIVQVGNELWMARTLDTEIVIGVGRRVHVEAFDGMTVVVRVVEK
jgi:membrane protein implicated in regulation of membrane protease activity